MLVISISGHRNNLDFYGVNLHHLLPDSILFSKTMHLITSNEQFLFQESGNVLNESTRQSRHGFVSTLLVCASCCHGLPLINTMRFAVFLYNCTINVCTGLKFIVSENVSVRITAAVAKVHSGLIFCSNCSVNLRLNC